ncbi:LPXTG cell wall anchor domain-containing protein, partial [Bacillus sp. B-TM1]
LPFAIFCLACPVLTIIVGFTGSGQTTTDNQNAKEATTVSENKEERDLPKTGTSVASTIGAGLAFIGAGFLLLFRRKKANR